MGDFKISGADISNIKFKTLYDKIHSLKILNSACNCLEGQNHSLKTLALAAVFPSCQNYSTVCADPLTCGIQYCTISKDIGVQAP